MTNHSTCDWCSQRESVDGGDCCEQETCKARRASEAYWAKSRKERSLTEHCEAFGAWVVAKASMKQIVATHVDDFISPYEAIQRETGREMTIYLKGIGNVAVTMRQLHDLVCQAQDIREGGANA